MRWAWVSVFALLWTCTGCRLLAGYDPSNTDARVQDARVQDARFEDRLDLSQPDAPDDTSADRGSPLDAPPLDADGPKLDVGGPLEPWGSWAASLPNMPDCNSAWPVLTVNTTADELDGGGGITTVGAAGTKLSLREAITIAANLDKAHTIVFDPAVFPLGSTDEIQIDLNKPFPNAVRACIDGRQRGVTLHWPPPPGQATSTMVPHLGPDSLMIGLTLRAIPYKILLASRAQVAGCWLHTTYKALAPGPQSVVGPGNAFSGGTSVLEIGSISAAVIVRDNDFGVDPRTQQVLSIGMAAEVWSGDALFEGNVFARGSYGFAFNGTPTAPGPVLRNNFFGVNRHGQLLPGGGAHVHAPQGVWIIGPGNTFRNTPGPAISVVGSTAQVLITQNSITGAGGKAIDAPLLPVPAPAIISAAPSKIRGDCTAAGVVEIFSDPGNQAETYLGSLPCDANTSWVYSVTDAPLPIGRNVTATFTAGGRTSELSAPMKVK